MATPAWIIPAFYDRLTGVADVQAIIDRLDALLKAVGVGWTEPVADTFQTPNDPAGRNFKLAFVRASATRLQCTMTDDQGRATVQKEMQISGTVAIQIYYSTRYVYIINETVADGRDYLWANMLTLFPESETVHNKYCVFYGGRNNAGAQSIPECNVMQSINAAGVYADRPDAVMAPYVQQLGSTVLAIPIHSSGGRRWSPYWHIGADPAGTRIRGRLYNALVMASTAVVIGNEYNVPIDQSNLGVFKVANMEAGGEAIVAVRKS